MTCDEAIKLMDGYLDGELDPITSQAIEQHLRECGRCDQAYKTQGSLIRAIGKRHSLFQGTCRVTWSESNPPCEREDHRPAGAKWCAGSSGPIP